MPCEAPALMTDWFTSPHLRPWAMTIALLLAAASRAGSEAPTENAPPLNAATRHGFPQLSLGAFYQSPADTHDQGSFETQRFFGSLGCFRPRPGAVSYRLGLSFEAASYDVAPASALPGGPWDRTYRLGAQVAGLGRAGTRWSYFAGPTIAVSGEAGAAWEDALTYGAIGGLTWVSPSRDLALGFGAGAFYGLEEFRAFPLLVTRWRINDQWQITNPLRAGPTGPAGLELGYTPAPLLSFGVGAAYRSDRFRLASREGPAGGGIGQQSGLPLWLRAGLHPHRFLHLNLYAGSILAGSLDVDDARGDALGGTGYDPTPFVSIVMNAGLAR